MAIFSMLTRSNFYSPQAIQTSRACDDILVEASGVDIPPPVKVEPVKPTPFQRHAMGIAVAGQDLVACAPTSAGKTAAIYFSIIGRIYEEMKKFAYRTGVRIVVTYCGKPIYRQPHIRDTVELMEMPQTMIFTATFSEEI
ncbi:hypothetical protein GQ457_02G035610 [Hibiscus cannabinus]